MGSIGSGELFIIAVVALMALDPKSAGRWWAKFRNLQRKLMDVREGFEREVRESISEEEPPRRETAQTRLRRWSADRVASLGQQEIDEAPEKILSRLRNWESYRQATAVAAFWPLSGEIPLEPVLRAIQADGKTVWLPWLGETEGSMDMAPVQDLESDLVAGKWNLREPREELRQARLPEGALVLVPGSVFDLHGARIGKGGGYYDRWLALRPDVVVVGTCWDAQVHPGRLPSADHDIPMGHLLTENRLVTFRSAVVEPPLSGTGDAAMKPLEDTHA